MREKKPTKSETRAAAVEQSWKHNDTRVIVRKRDVLQYELDATEEHLKGLRVSLANVQNHHDQLASQIDGLTRVLNKR